MSKHIAIRNLADTRLLPNGFDDLLMEIIPIINRTTEHPLRDVLVCGSSIRGEFSPFRSDIDLIAVMAHERTRTSYSIESANFTSRAATMIEKIDIHVRPECESECLNNLADLVYVCDSASLFTGKKTEQHSIEKNKLIGILIDHLRNQGKSLASGGGGSRRRAKIKFLAREYQLRLLGDFDFFSFSLSNTLGKCLIHYPAERDRIASFQRALGLPDAN